MNLRRLLNEEKGFVIYGNGVIAHLFFELLKKEKQEEQLRELQKKYLTVVREEREVRLADEFDCTAFDEVVDEFICLIREKIGE